MKKLEKLFGGLNLTWPKLIIFALLAGLYTGAMAMLPFAKGTSLADISISFEWWVLFGVLIIVNSKTPMDSALKCFVFFLISQPLVYLVQVPFYSGGWAIFAYYKNWIIWTLLTLPMGFIGHYMKKDKWWGLVILVPMMTFVGYHFFTFLRSVVAGFPYHLLSAIFCAVTVLLYPVAVFRNKKIKYVGLIIGVVLLMGAAVPSVVGHRSTYETMILTSADSGEEYFDDSYTAVLEDEAYGTISVDYEEEFDCYVLNATFTKRGETKLIVTSPEGEKVEYDITVGNNTYSLNRAE